jgi:hypothetical protein
MAKPDKFNVLSPDGFPISAKPFNSQKEAEAAIPEWCERYEEQGHYTTADRERIPVKELPNHVKVVPEAETPSPETGLDAKFKKLGHHVRLGWEKQEIDTDKNIATAKAAVKEQWQKEREESLAKPAPTTPEPEKTKGKDIEPPEPDMG